jgi:hypothetical protein
MNTQQLVIHLPSLLFIPQLLKTSRLSYLEISIYHTRSILQSKKGLPMFHDLKTHSIKDSDLFYSARKVSLAKASALLPLTFNNSALPANASNAMPPSEKEIYLIFMDLSSRVKHQHQSIIITAAPKKEKRPVTAMQSSPAIRINKERGKKENQDISISSFSSTSLPSGWV